MAATQPSAGSPDQSLVELDAQANAAYQAGAFESASKLFIDLYERTDDANYLYNLAVCYDRLDRLQEAVDTLNKYAAEAPDHDREAVAAKLRGFEIRLETAEREGDASDQETDDTSSDDGAPAISTDATDDDTAAGRSMPLDIAGGVALGLGVTGVAVGIGLGVTSNGHKDSVESGCVAAEAGLLCSDAERDDTDKAKSFALGADVAIIAGGVLVVGGVALLVANTVRAKKRRNVAFAPAVGPRLTGIALSGTF